ncbi:PAN2-PAN3 deadenylation complex catalytic subunit PAN2 isoform X2 [Hydra vulgaris]|uniref:PAN2-PAN3 deadenylation complex catalytic subunit PAN2 n=1 Tax=Hydra vulgaris TaxID=6087 RepID=A0ABM4BGL0_HYDVU
MELENGNEQDLFVGEYQELCVVHNDPLLNLYTTAVKFDSHEQLFWVGSQSGRMSSYYGSQMVKYTSFKAHHTELCDILTDAHGVLSLTTNEVRYTTKQGLKIFSSRNENMHSMHALLRGTGVAESYVLMAGENEYFFELDLTTGYVYEKSKTDNASTVVMKQSSHYICCGQKNGKVRLYDPDRMEICHTLDAHSGSLLDFDLNGNTLVTCGFSSRYGHLSADQYIMVYDLRTLRSFPPVHVPIEPSFVRFMPTYTLRCLLVSQIGQFILCQPDSLTLDQYLYTVNIGDVPITSCCVSDTYQGIGFGDAAGYVHLWGNRAEDGVLFNHSNQLSVFPDEIEPLESFTIDDWSVPLTSIQMPECSEPLLSDWPEHLIKRVDRPTPPLDPEILKNVTMRQFVGYAPNPKTKLRNQVAYILDLDNGSKYPESPMSRDGGKCVIPKIYQKVDIKYSKYGVEDFNFKHYNQTPFSGLEIHIPNAYCNAMLQVFYFLDVLRVSMHNHLCQREFCIACELGFLFYMLDVADGQTCQASNFLRTFRTLPEASALGLLVNENMSVSCNRSISQTIQNWNRFVLRQLHQDTKNTRDNVEEKNEEKIDVSFIVDAETDEAKQKVFTDEKVSKFECSSDIKDLFGMDIISNRTCKCGVDSERKATLFSIDLSYPEVTDSDTDDDYPFVKILNESIVRKQSTQAWCESCKKYQHSTQFRKVISVPPVLNINCRLDNAKEISFWRKQQELADPVDDVKKLSTHSQPKFCRYGKFCNRQGCRFVHQGREGEKLLTPPGSEVDETINEKSKHWLPTLIQVKHNKETQEVKISRHDEESNEAEGIVYRLISNVCHIYDSSFGSTLVAHIKVGKQYHLIKEGKEQDHWYLFNDFAIAPISENEAVTFNLSWKVPCILMYARQDIDSLHNLEIKPKFDSSLLFAERSLATRQARFSRNFTPLNSTEILKEGDIVGVDAEFVTLNQEESEMRRDGTLSTLRPSQMSVARITVVRGWGPLTGVPFIDDYISTSEQVVDYLTKFSGIKPGDLDASMSSKHLTTLKLAYQKLRYLIGQKVVFIGHGLKKDFRVINLVIPRDQVVDTVELFHIPKQRYVSLKFLAWHFLNIKIQADCHDSAEDAYTALKLYEKYRELLRAGEWVLEEELEILYDTGRQYNWQVPE